MTKPVARTLIGATGFFLFVGCQKPPPSPLPLSPVSTPTVQPALPEPPPGDLLSQGMWWLYQMQYDKARRDFESYNETHPHEPAGHFYQLATDWWQLAQNFELTQPEIVARFDRDSEKTIRIAKALEKSKSPEDRARGLLFEGGAWGLRGRLEVTQGHWLEAYHAGKRGHSCLKKALELDPHLEDAYLGLGIYDYYADTLRGVQAVLSSLLMHGDRKRGLEEIERAKNNGKHARVEAMLFLIDINVSWEKQPEKAVLIARELYHEYPQSPAMHLAVISTLCAAKKWKEVSQEAASFLEDAQKQMPFYSAKHIPAGLYYEGLAALHENHPDLCNQRMNEILQIKDIPRESRWISFAYLRRGQAYDDEGEREKAIADYKHVLSRPDVWESHQEASACLKAPCTFKTDVTSTDGNTSKG